FLAYLCSRVAARPQAPPSFPTRRSSDLRLAPPPQSLNLGVQLALCMAPATCWSRGLFTSAAQGGSFHVGEIHSSLKFPDAFSRRSEEHTSELQSRENLVCRLLLEKKKRL